jgi:hypothetical protein
MTAQGKCPSPTELRALSRAALLLQLDKRPESPSEDVDPVQRAQQIREALLHSKHREAYTWLQAHVAIDKAVKRQRNPAFAEIEIIRAAADATAAFLGQTATTAKAGVERLRRTREAIECVLDNVSLSESTRKELSLSLRGLRWLGAIGTKGRLREQVLLFHIFARMEGWTDEAIAVSITPLLVALSGTPKESASREVRRWLAAYQKHLAALREEVESENPGTAR